MSGIDRAIHALRVAQIRMGMSHKALLEAMVELQNGMDSPDAEIRLASRSLLLEAAEQCSKLNAALDAGPEVAMPKLQRTEDGGQPSSPKATPSHGKTELPPLKTAASMLKKHREGLVARSARYGRPILAAISCLMILFAPCAMPSARGDTVDRVIDALVQIESSGRPGAIGDGGKAVGLLQLHPVAVREANRLAGSKVWKLSDRLCPAKSRAMARTILAWHYQRGVTDPVELACKWNRPFGQTTAQYRAKVEAALEI